MNLKQAVGTLVLSSLIVGASFGPALATPSKAELDQRLKQIEDIVPGLQSQIGNLESDVSQLKVETAKIGSLQNEINDLGESLSALALTVDGRTPLRATVIENSVVRLGDVNGQFDKTFNCPGIDLSKPVMLVYMTAGVSGSRNLMRVNNVAVANAFPLSAGENKAAANIALLGGGQHRLKETGNVLFVESRSRSGNANGDVDEFSFDNMVIYYHTK